MEELNTDRLIEYYFQRKLKGMELDAIEKSISAQVILEEERNVILNSIALKEKIGKRPQQLAIVRS